MQFDFDLAVEILPWLAKGAMITLEATVAGFAIAVVGGIPLLLLRRSRSHMVSKTTGFIVEFIRNTPILVQLFFLYFVAPSYGITLDPLATGILVLGVHYSCYMSEVYRSGLENVHSGQWDAATALSFSPWQTFRYIVFPQAIPPIIPAAGNYLIYMFKDSPLLAAISVPEMMHGAQKVGSENFQYLEPITVVGVIFLVMSLASAALLQVVERRIGRRWR